MIDFPTIREGRFGVLLPAYQAGNTLGELLQELLQVIPSEGIILVDDGSTDETVKKAEQYGITVFCHEKNRGKGTALRTGLLQAQIKHWDWVITMDADGQHAPLDLMHFLDSRPSTQTGILVGTRRRSGTDMPWHRRFSNATTTGIISLLARTPVFDAQSGYRAYRTRLVDFLPKEGRFEWEAQALILSVRQGYGVESIPITTLYNEQGSHMRLVRDTGRFLNMVGKLIWTR